MKTLPVSKFIACILLAMGTTIALAIRCPSNVQYFLIYTIIGVAIALFFIRSAGLSTLRFKFRGSGLALSGAIVLPFVLFFTNPVGRFKSDSCRLEQGITVFVHGKKGTQDIVLRQQGYVILDYGAERKRSVIDDKGEAHFENLHAGDRIKLNIDFSEPYRSVHPDSIYIVDERGAIYLQVYLEGGNLVEGNIMYKDAPLSGVLVTIRHTASGVSDSLGNFSLAIPDSLQNRSYEVSFNKPGFAEQKAIAYPQTGIPLTVFMKKL